MNSREAKAEGIERGYQAAIYCEVDDIDRREAAGCDCVDGGECEACVSQAAYEAEQNSRQMADHPACTAAFRTEEGEPDWWEEARWDAYEKGVGIGVKRGVRERLKGKEEEEAANA